MGTQFSPWHHFFELLSKLFPTWVTWVVPWTLISFKVNLCYSVLPEQLIMWFKQFSQKSHRCYRTEYPLRVNSVLRFVCPIEDLSLVSMTWLQSYCYVRMGTIMATFLSKPLWSEVASTACSGLLNWGIRRDSMSACTDPPVRKLTTISSRLKHCFSCTS